MENTRKFPLFLNSFWLKVIALLTMTIDHIGSQLEGNYYYDWLPDFANVLRIIGRIALPLFCFMIAEGAIHTKSFGKYSLRLGIMASLISVVIVGAEYIKGIPSMRLDGNIFIDLLLGATAIYCLRQNKWYLKALAALPLMYGIASFLAASFESCGCHGHILWFPFFMRTQYGWYGIALCILFYVAKLLARVFISYLSEQSGVKEENYIGSIFERHAINIISALMIIFGTLLYYFTTKALPEKYIYLEMDTQLFAMLAGAFILLYNGRRGYNKKWFQYGSYIYYPLHLAIIYLIFEII